MYAGPFQYIFRQLDAEKGIIIRLAAALRRYVYRRLLDARLRRIHYAGAPQARRRRDSLFVGKYRRSEAASYEYIRKSIFAESIALCYRDTSSFAASVFTDKE